MALAGLATLTPLEVRELILVRDDHARPALLLLLARRLMLRFGLAHLLRLLVMVLYDSSN